MNVTNNITSPLFAKTFIKNIDQPVFNNSSKHKIDGKHNQNSQKAILLYLSSLSFLLLKFIPENSQKIKGNILLYLFQKSLGNCEDRIKITRIHTHVGNKKEQNFNEKLL